MMKNKIIKIYLYNNTSKIRIITATFMMLLLNSNVLMGQSPGGVAGASLWYDPLTGITTYGTNIREWKNRGTYTGVDLVNLVDTSRPSLGSYTAGSNYNPYIIIPRFRYLRTLNRIPTGVSSHTTFLVNKLLGGGDPGTMNSMIHFNGSGNTTIEFGLGTTENIEKVRLYYFNGGIRFLDAPDSQKIPYDTQSDLIGARVKTGFNRLKEISLAGQTIASQDDPGSLGVERFFNIGDRWTRAASGDIKEIVFYDQALSDVDQRKVNTYLAIKWGLTLAQPQEYVSSKNVILWNPTIEPGYNNNIFGIGREDNSSLYQRVSNSINAGSILKAARSNDFISENNNSRIGISDDSTYLLFGDNINTSLQLIDDGCEKGLLQRRWLAQPSGELIDTYIQVDLSNYPTIGSKVEMLVSDVNDFAQYEVVQATSSTGKVFVFNHKFPDFRYITFRNIGALPAGPTIAKANLVNNCDNSNTSNTRSVNLSEAGVGEAPAGRELRWYRDTNRTQAVDPANNIDRSGEFYAFYYDPIANCYSQPSVLVTVTITECIACVKPGNPDVSDIFTKIGISSQSSVTKNWPENIPNGFIALESKDKGFVISRVQKASDIIEPKEGMLIYDIDAKCIKLYNGAIWKCIEKKCNDKSL